MEVLAEQVSRAVDEKQKKQMSFKSGFEKKLSKLC